MNVDGAALLAGGTTYGRVGLWKYCPSPGAIEPEDQWQSQTPSSVSGPVLEVAVGLLLYIYTFIIIIIIIMQLLMRHVSVGKITKSQVRRSCETMRTT